MTLDEIIEKKADELADKYIDEDDSDSNFIANGAYFGYSKGFKDALAIEFVWWLLDNYKIWNIDDGTWMNLISKSAYRTEELYLEFLKTIEK